MIPQGWAGAAAAAAVVLLAGTALAQDAFSTAPRPDSDTPVQAAPAPDATPAPAPAEEVGLPKAPVAAAEAPPPAPPVRFTLLHPQVMDSATLAADGRTVPLSGIAPLPDPSGGLQRYLLAQGDQVSCEARGDAFACALPDGTDVALVSLANGAATAKPDAPDIYRQQEAAAQAARRGAWAGLPPPPVILMHPSARTSALLAADGRSYPLDGLQGLPGQPAAELQAYIAAHGDAATCQQQPGGRTFLCILPDGSDIGKVALVNGAARLAAPAPAGYQAQQADAAANRRGIWAVAMAVPVPVPVMPAYPVLPPDGPVTYLGDQPTAVIDGEQAFFVFGGAGLGWGYWDHFHRWHGAPERYARHLERFHPDGRVGTGRPGAERLEAGRPGFARIEPGRAAFAPGRPGFVPGRPGFVAERPGFVAGRGGFTPAFGRPAPAFARPEFGRPPPVAMGGRVVAPAMAPHPMAAPAPRPAAPARTPPHR